MVLLSSRPKAFMVKWFARMPHVMQVLLGVLLA